MKNARPTEGKTSAREQGDSKATATFLGTDNPRYLRALQALLTRPIPREQLDRVAGCSNGPSLIAELRALGLPAPECLPCERVPCFDRDGEEVRRGVYSLTPVGRRRVHAWMRKRATKGGQP
jgi:hypothetical protein